jgi:subtilisin family serine protease
MNGSVPRAAYDGSGLSIAICDTGIDTSHPRLGGGGSPIFNAKVIGGYDFGMNDTDPRPAGNAHGTACAGIAAGDTGTVGDYIGGVAPGAKLYSLKISREDFDHQAFDPDMVEAWEWTITHQDDDPNNPIMIISTSFGGGQFFATCDGESPSMTTAAANAVAAGITIFASAGNDGFCNALAWPACISYVNSVGAVYDAGIGNPGFCVDSASCTGTVDSNYCSPPAKVVWDSTAADKVTAYSNSAPFLTLFAPSHNAYTTDIVGAGGYNNGTNQPGVNRDYDSGFGGTSAASPYAAGAAAVLQSAAKAILGSYLTPAEVRQYLVNNGDLLTDSKPSGITKPRVNLDNAVNALGFLLQLTRTGRGLVTSFPAGINCGTDCSQYYPPGTPVTLTANAYPGAPFLGWSGEGCSGTGPCDVVMAQGRNVTANFFTFPWPMFLPAISGAATSSSLPARVGAP